MDSNYACDLYKRGCRSEAGKSNPPGPPAKQRLEFCSRIERLRASRACRRYREPVEGTPFGRYQLIELLGRGGMGEVWRAHDTAIDRTVALKMLLPHFAKDPDYEKRFRREARAAARLDDPHVVPIYDVGEIDDRLYVTMRLINGTDLQTLLKTGPLEPARAVHIIEQ